jgi:hypothetical protein
MRKRSFVPAVVVIACSSNGAGKGGGGTYVPEGPYTEFRDGVCQQPCVNPPDAKVNSCNPPPPPVIVECTDELLPTQPPGTEVTRQEDGTCWVECTEETCDAPGSLRVRCPRDGEAPPTYEANLVIPAQTEVRGDDYVVMRKEDLTCTMDQNGTISENVRCPPEIAVRAADGVVPVISSERHLCFYGTVVVACPERFHVWH